MYQIIDNSIREVGAIKYLKGKNGVSREDLLKSSGINTSQLDTMIDKRYIKRTTSENGDAYSLDENGLAIASMIRGTLLGYLYQALRGLK